MDKGNDAINCKHFVCVYWFISDLEVDIQMNYHPGQRIVTSDGTVRTVALIINGQLYCYAPNGWLEKVRPRYEAWGGEHEAELGLAA